MVSIRGDFIFDSPALLIYDHNAIETGIIVNNQNRSNRYGGDSWILKNYA
jgi:hypothetical protein